MNQKRKWQQIQIHVHAILPERHTYSLTEAQQVKVQHKCFMQN
jgi:hypothetical protein